MDTRPHCGYDGCPGPGRKITGQITDPNRDLDRLYRRLAKAIAMHDQISVRRWNREIVRLETMMMVGAI